MSQLTNSTALWFHKNEIAVSTVHNCMLLVENLYLILQFIGESYTPFCTVYGTLFGKKYMELFICSKTALNSLM
jgi:hypothetical protein